MSNGAKVSLTGRLTKDPTQKDWQGTTVVSFSVAVNTNKKKGDDYVADYYNVSVWGKQGEFILPRIEKGTLVQVYGDLVMQTYTDKNNVERQSMAVRATDVMPLTAKKKTTEAKEDDEAPPF